MIESKKGMSDIVVTLVIILLSLIAIGVVWVVVNNLIKSGTQNVEISAKCTNVQLEITAVSCNATTGADCTVTVKKTGTSETLSGVKLAFSNSTGSYTANALDAPHDLASLVPTVLNGTTGTTFDSGVINPNSVEVTPYFIDSANNEYPCTSQKVTRAFTAS